MLLIQLHFITCFMQTMSNTESTRYVILVSDVQRVMQSTTGFMHICTEHIFELLYFEICARHLCSQTVNKENDTLGQEPSTAQRAYLRDCKREVQHVLSHKGQQANQEQCCACELHIWDLKSLGILPLISKGVGLQQLYLQRFNSIGINGIASGLVKS